MLLLLLYNISFVSGKHFNSRPCEQNLRWKKFISDTTLHKFSITYIFFGWNNFPFCSVLVFLGCYLKVKEEKRWVGLVLVVVGVLWGFCGVFFLFFWGGVVRLFFVGLLFCFVPWKFLGKIFEYFWAFFAGSLEWGGSEYTDWLTFRQSGKLPYSHWDTYSHVSATLKAGWFESDQEGRIRYPEFTHPLCRSSMCLGS